MMTKTKFFILTILLATCLFSAYAGVSSNRATIDLSYQIVLPQKTQIAGISASYLFKTGPLTTGPEISVGYSVRHFKEMGSNALVYGPALSLGLNTNYTTGRYDIGMAYTVDAVYGLFPQILWHHVKTQAGYMITNKVRISAELSVLHSLKAATPQWGCSIGTGIGVVL